MSTRTLFRTDAERRVSTRNLKCCPLCGAINARQNGACFVCTWSGSFSHDPVEIEQGLLDLLSKCPELSDAVFRDAEVPKAKWWQKLRMALRRPLDLWA